MSTSDSNPTFSFGECPVCVQEDALFILPCSHTGYCKDCHAEALRHLQEGDRKPECPTCSTAIPIEAFESILDPEQYATIKTRMLAWGIPTDERFYCANSPCLQFIPPSAPTSSRGRECLNCHETTCLACKKTAHDGACPEDEGLKAAVEAALNDGARPCPFCGTLIIRNGGCQHIYAHPSCDKEFCILCLREWKDCLATCEGTKDDLLGQEVYDNDIPDWANEWDHFEDDDALAIAERLAGARLRIEFNDRDMFSFNELLAVLSVTLAVHREYLATTTLIQWLLDMGQGLLDDVLEDRINRLDPLDEQHLSDFNNFARLISQARDHAAAELWLRTDDPYEFNLQAIDDFLGDVHELRSEGFIVAEQEAIEMLSMHQEPDLAERRRYYMNLLLCFVRPDSS